MYTPPPPPAESEFWFGWFAWCLILAVPVAAVTFGARNRWRTLISQLRVVPPALVELEKPGILEERLSESKVVEILNRCIADARTALGSHGRSDAATWLQSNFKLESVAVPFIRPKLLQALQSGRPQSLLLPYGDRYVYFVAFPGRHEHHQLLRRYSFLAYGWSEHIAGLRRNTARGKSIEILCFLMFFREDAHDVVGVFAFESDALRLECVRLLDPDERNAPHVQTFENACYLTL